jgi:hypothetical protein
MAIEAVAKVVVQGISEALRAAQGVTRAARESNKAGQEQAKAADAANKQAIRGHQERVKAAEKAAAATAAAAQKQQAATVKALREANAAAAKAEREQEALAQKQTDYWQKAAQKQADQRIRQEERVTKAAVREAAKQAKEAERTAAQQKKTRDDTFRRVGGAVGALAAGALAGGIAAVGTARAVGGYKSVQDRVTSANEFRERLVGVTSAAGLSPEEREATQAKVLAASKATGKDQGELLSVLETGHGQFNDLRFFRDNLQEIATISKVANADTGDFARALGSVKQAFGLTGDEAIQAAYLMKASADKGSVELKDFARDFAASSGIFAQNTKQRGIAGVRQFLGTAQGIATGQFGSAESSTRLERFIADINDVGVRKELGKIGITNVADANGKVDVGALLDRLGNSRQFKSAAVRQGIFKETRSLQAVEALVAAREREKTGGVGFRSIAGVDEAAGRTAVSQGFSALSQEGFFKMQVEAAKMQADVTTNLEDYNKQVLRVLEASNKLESAFGSLALWANAIAASAVVGGVAKLALGNMTGAGGLAGAAGGGSLTGLAINALKEGGSIGKVAAGGGLAGAGVMAAGALAAGAAGYGVGTFIDSASANEHGDKWSDRIGNAMFELFSNASDSARNRIGGTTTNGNIDGKGGTQEIVRVLEKIDSGLRANADKPKPGASRSPP